MRCSPIVLQKQKMITSTKGAAHESDKDARKAGRSLQSDNRNGVQRRQNLYLHQDHV